MSGHSVLLCVLGKLLSIKRFKKQHPEHRYLPIDTQTAAHSDDTSSPMSFNTCYGLQRQAGVVFVVVEAHTNEKAAYYFTY